MVRRILTKRKERVVSEDSIRYIGVGGVPHIREMGNSIRRNTSAWRVEKPVLVKEKCIKCRICWMVCPDHAMHIGRNGYPVWDYHVCKGCLLCYNECPVKAIEKMRDLHEEDSA